MIRRQTLRDAMVKSGLSLAMGLAVAKLPHVTVSAGEFPEGGDEGFVGVGWKGQGERGVEGGINRRIERRQGVGCVRVELEGLGEELVTCGEGVAGFRGKPLG